MDQNAKLVDCERVLWMNRDEDTVITISIIEKKGLPQLKVLSVVEQELKNGVIVKREYDPYFKFMVPEENLTANEIKLRDNAWSCIKDIVELEPNIYDPKERYQIIKDVCKRTGKGKKFIYKYLRYYWMGGKMENALLPRFRNCGGRGKTKNQKQKMGRPRITKEVNPEYTGIPVTEGIRKIFDEFIRTVYLKVNKRHSVRFTYIEMLKNRFSIATEIRDGREIPIIPPNHKVPSISQLRYHIRTKYKSRTKLLAREGEVSFNRDFRPLLGSETRKAAGPGQIFEIDATVADVYLVSSDNTNQIIGRPVVYIVVDVWSHMVVGIYIGFEGPSWQGVMMAIENTVVNKVEFCAEFDIEIKEDEWPCNHVPQNFYADRGEMESKNADSIGKSLGIKLKNAPPYRADLKGIVEQQFRTLNITLQPWMPGAVKKEYKKRGGPDYVLDAKLTLKDFTKMVIELILYRNNYHYMEHYPLDKAHVKDKVLPVARDLWNWGVAHDNFLHQVHPDIVRLNVLPEVNVTASREGIYFGGMYFACNELADQGWFVKGKSIKTVIAFDRRCMNHVYVKSDDGKSFIKCYLLEKSSRFRDLSLEEVKMLRYEEKLSGKLYESTKLQEEVTLSAKLELIKNDAENRFINQKDNSLTKSERKSNIKGNNDVRIYLDRYLRKEPRILSDVSNRLADYLLSGAGDIRTKHELIFDFLQNSNRHQEFIDVFSRQYVTEAFDVKRPMVEIMTQFESTLNSQKQILDYEKVLSLSCAVATMHQFDQSLQWMDQQYSEEVELPTALLSERKVTQRDFLQVDILYNMLGDTMLLIQHGEIPRAKSNLNRWLGTFDPEAIAEILKLNAGDVDNDSFEEDLARMLELWGKISQHTGIYFSNKKYDDSCSDKIKHIEANFAKGWLEEGKSFFDLERIKNTLGQLNIYYSIDLNDYLMSIVASEKAEAIEFLVNCGIKEQYNNNLKLLLTVWSIQHDLEELCSEWISEIKSEQFSYINKEDFDSSKTLFPYYCKIVYVVSYCDTINLDEITRSCLLSYRDGNFTPSDRGYYAAVQFIQISAWLGKLNRTLNNADTPSLNSTDFSNIIDILLNYNDWRNRFEVNGFEIETDLLKAVIRMYPRQDAEFRKQVDLTFSNRAKDFENIAHLDIYWNHLNKIGYNDPLKQLFDKWMEPSGYVWKKELHEINSIVQDFIAKALKLGWTDRVTEIQRLLNSRIIGYVGRKEYSLYTLLNWYKRISCFQDPHWGTSGVTLLNISEIASQTGDNKAGVYIEASVAESAGRMGANELWKFANLKDYWNFEWLQAIFDGVIAALEHNEFTQDQLHEIWDVATNTFFISDYAPKYDARNKLNRIYIADIKEAIILAADRLGLHDTVTSMQDSAPAAFSQTRTDTRNSYKIPERWYDRKQEYNDKLVSAFCDDIKELSCTDAFSVLQERFKQKESFRWDMILPYCQ